MDHQQELVDEPVLHQRLDQVAAAEYDELLVELILDSLDGARDVLRQQCRVLPRQRLLQRGRNDVFLSFVERGRERVVVDLLGPEVVELLVRPAAEQHRAASSHPLADHLAHDLIPVGSGPAAVGEAAAWVFIGATRTLHHAIERYVVVHDELAHAVSPPANRLWN